MNTEAVAKLVAALRSGKYKQTDGALKDGDGYCCLGVAWALPVTCTKRKPDVAAFGTWLLAKSGAFS